VDRNTPRARPHPTERSPIVVCVLILALLLAACGGGDDDAPTPTIPPPAATPTAAAAPTAMPTVAIAPTATTASAQPTTIEIGGAPFNPAVADGVVWVPNTGNSTIARIDPATNEVVATIALDVPPGDLSQGPPSVFVTARDGVVWAYRRLSLAGSGGAAELVRIDPADNSLAQTIALDLSPDSLAIGPDGDLWFTTGEQQQL
jgi:streptogramin lyase